MLEVIFFILEGCFLDGIWKFIQMQPNEFFELQDQFDTIDLSDNEIVKLENFPYLTRLGTLLLNSNRITRINPNVGGRKIKQIEYYFYIVT